MSVRNENSSKGIVCKIRVKVVVVLGFGKGYVTMTDEKCEK